MTTIQILVKVIEHFDVELPDPPGPGHRFLFSNDLALERYDDSTPGSGLPQDEDQRLAGTHSGFVTLLRVAGANDRFFPDGSDLWQYDATYKFNTLDDTPLQKGQVTARGVLLFQGEHRLEPPVRFAITGGTGPYATAHGTITEGVPTEDHRLLDIELSPGG
jgi:hypothetical protein